MDSIQSMASGSSSSAVPSSERTSHFISQTEMEMESSKARHWSQLDYSTTDSECSAETNSKHFDLLRQDPEWGRFFRDFETLEVGEKISDGAQADIYEARMTRAGPFDLVVKVMKGDAPLQTFQAQWPIGMLAARSKYKHLLDLPLMRILGGTMLHDKRLRGRFAFVMYRHWGDLRLLIDRRMKQERSTPGPFPIDEAIHLMLSIAEDLDMLHNKHDIIHRDLKASNVLVWREFGEDMNLVAAPNRVARIRSLVADFECSVGVLGTGFWRAPEILEQLKDRVPSSKVHFTRTSDVYSYGMTCYEIVTGCFPYGGRGDEDTTISQILQGRRPELPPELPEFVRKIIIGCWHSDPLERPGFSAICMALKLKRGPNPVIAVNNSQRGASIVKELPGLTNYACITNEIRGEGEIEADILHTDKSKSEVQLEFKEIWNAGKPTSIGDYLPIDLTRDLLGASSRGYVIRTTCPDGQGGRCPCALKRIDTMDESEPDLARLCHPHVVHLLHHWKKKIDYDKVREWMPKSAFMTFLMMELMDGDLGNLMTSIKTAELTPFSLLVAVHVMMQIAKGMLYLHEMGVSHPHLKCSNVLFRLKSAFQIPFRAGDILVKLGGFGCSRAANEDTKNRDVFCFGLTCLEILTGDECFEDIYGPDKISRPSIPETTPYFLKKCIASCLDTKITFSEAISLLLLSQSQIMLTCEDKMILCSVNLDIRSTLSNNQDIASSSTSKSDRQEMFHVHQLHPQLGEVATAVQFTLIFFHGFPKVSEEWRMTWLTRDNKLVWPQMWLPKDLGADIRVLSVSFNDNPNVSSTQSIMDLLKILVMSATCKLGETDQAIVLVGHSFGGVIIKALVAAAQDLAGKTFDNNVEFQEVLKCKKFLKRLASIVFYSVPHAFVNMEFENYISGCSNTRVLQRSSLLKALRRDSVFISDMIQLSRDFENAVPRKTKLLAFLEGKPMSKKSLLVTENSWEGLLLSWEWHKIDRDNHFEVCRPVSKSHIGYKVLLNHLRQHMCPSFAVKVWMVWKVIGTVLICICKFKEVLSRYRMVSRTIEGMTPKELLLTCATAIELKDVSTIRQTVSALRNISSVNGEPSERVTAYFLQALQRRCVSMLGPKSLSGADLPSHREEQEPASRSMLDVLTNFVDLSPYVRFGYVAANGAMLKAFEGMGRIHIVDFSTTHGMQWRFFIAALADRVGGPPNFRLTLSGPSLPIVPHPTYEKIGHHLTKYARLRNVPLEFNVLAPPLERLSFSDFDVRDGEALGVNFSLGLHYLADESAGLPEYPPPLETQLEPRCPRDNLLHLIRSLNPTIVTLYEKDCDATSTDVVKRVQQSYEHEWIPFDFMAALLPSGNKERQEYEKIVGMKIENIVACEGERRIERLESRRQWMQRMRRLGFLSLPVGYEVVAALRDMLDHGWGMKNEVIDCTQSLLWKGRSLAFASAWAPHFSNPAACHLDSEELRRQQQECQKTSPEVLDFFSFDVTSTLDDAQGTVEEYAVEAYAAPKVLFEEKNTTVELARLTREFLLSLTFGSMGEEKMLKMSEERLEVISCTELFQLALQESLQKFLDESWAHHVPNEIEKWFSLDHLRPLQDYLQPFQSEFVLRPLVSLEQQNLKAWNDSETTLSPAGIDEFRDSDPAVIRPIEESLGGFSTNQPAGMLHRKATILRALDGAALGDTSDGGGAHGTALELQQQQQSIDAGHKMFKGPERAAHTQVDMAESKRRPRYSIETRSEIELIDDGYKWRKCGLGAEENSGYYSNYYECTTANCPARKEVERSTEDLSPVRALYEGTHSHPANATHYYRQWTNPSAAANTGNIAKQEETLGYLLQTPTTRLYWRQSLAEEIDSLLRVENFREPGSQVLPQKIRRDPHPLPRRDTSFQTNLTLLRAHQMLRLHYETVKYYPVPWAGPEPFAYEFSWFDDFDLD